MKAFEVLHAAYTARRRMWNLALSWFAAVTVLRFPGIVGWLPPEQQKDVFAVADFVQRYGVGLALFWAKDATVSGNGSETKPTAKNIGGQNTPL
jgi:hypothetical protein